MSVNEPYLGMEFSPLLCDKFAIAKIDKSVLAEDVELFETKWWDYRTMHPTQATLYFHQQYKLIGADFVAKYVDMDMGKGMRIGHARNDLRAAKVHQVRGFWRARQTADAIGVPYDVYLRVAFQHFFDNYRYFQSAKSGKQVLPYSTQLYSQAIVDKAITEWQAIRDSPGFPRLPESNDILGHHVWFRPAMEQDLLDQFKTKSNPRAHVADALKRGLIIRTK